MNKPTAACTPPRRMEPSAPPGNGTISSGAIRIQPSRTLTRIVKVTHNWLSAQRAKYVRPVFIVVHGNKRLQVRLRPNARCDSHEWRQNEMAVIVCRREVDAVRETDRARVDVRQASLCRVVREELPIVSWVAKITSIASAEYVWAMVKAYQLKRTVAPHIIEDTR
jgi:hypothetical protein